MKRGKIINACFYYESHSGNDGLQDHLNNTNLSYREHSREERIV